MGIGWVPHEPVREQQRKYPHGPGRIISINPHGMVWTILYSVSAFDIYIGTDPCTLINSMHKSFFLPLPQWATFLLFSFFLFPRSSVLFFPPSAFPASQRMTMGWGTSTNTNNRHCTAACLLFDSCNPACDARCNCNTTYWEGGNPTLRTSTETSIDNTRLTRRISTSGIKVDRLFLAGVVFLDCILPSLCRRSVNCTRDYSFIRRGTAVATRQLWVIMSRS